MIFAARYAGVCPECGERFEEGTLVEYRDGAPQPAHAGRCPADRDRARATCPTCFLLKPCGCDD